MNNLNLISISSFRQLFNSFESFIKVPVVEKLLIFFLIYIIVIYLYAWRYYRIYKHDSNSFLFNAIIKKKQIAVLKKEAATKLNMVNNFIPYLSTLNEIFNSNEIKIKTTDNWYLNDQTSEIIIDNLNFKFYTDAMKGPRPTLNPTYRLQITPIDKIKKETSNFSKTENELIRTYIIPNKIALIPKNLNEGRGLVENWYNEILLHKNKYNNRLKTLSESSPNIWKFLDFLYFSLITQTTVGYGDILPNCTHVRTIVMFQVAIGYIMLIVVLNIILSN